MKKIKIKDKFEIETKRFYLPVIIPVKCAHCGTKHEFNLSDRYLSYPVINKKSVEGFWCDKCDEESEIDLTLRVRIDVSETRKQ